MAIISGSEVSDLVNFLKTEEIKIYHACQLDDYTSYLELGGIPSRSYLEQSGKSYTKFVSDESDKAKGVWDKVFFNFNDFGFFFHKLSSQSTPNLYGPILIELEPDFLENASDISITLCSVTDSAFSREKDSLSLAEVKTIFKKHANGKSYLKNKRDLKKIFPTKKVMGIEINCTFKKVIPHDKTTLDSVINITVDPIKYESVALVNRAKEITYEYHPTLKDMVRSRYTERLELLSQLVLLASTGANTEKDIQEQNLIAQKYQNWLEGVLKLPPSRGFILGRYLDYLNKGTLNKLKNNKENVHKRASGE